MPRYKWTGAGTFRDRRNEREVEPGDVVELDEHVGGPNRELVEVEDEPATADEDESEVETVGPEGTDNLEIASLEVEPPVDPNEYTIGELEDALEDVSLSDAEREALLEAERADGDERVGAIEAIEGA